VDELWFDVFGVISGDPSCRVEYEALESRVSVVIGDPPGESSSISFWLKNPDTVVSLGRELVGAGMRLKAGLRTSASAVADLSQGEKPDGIESGEER
jgi:hypothetical protein